MENSENLYWKKIRLLGIVSLSFPFIIMVAGILLSRKGISGLVEGYEEGMARILQYMLFGIGVVIFFFCDGISDFFANRLLVKDKEREQENLSSYFAYVFIILWLLNMISITGFTGFLICGNLTWLTVFVILNYSLQIKYFPSPKRLERLLSLIKR